jgi:nucleoside-diphosphate-sugar epimerase
MKCIVTGAAGFIGSHLSQKLLKENYEVLGIDDFQDYYPKWIKERNIAPLLKQKNFNLMPENINSLDSDSLLANHDCIFHLAAQAGVRSSWGENFSVYTRNNIDTTQKLLESAKKNDLKKFIYASSSSVYGDCHDLPMKENSPLKPYSPYGVTKLAAEHLCTLYYRNYSVPTVSLRFFTVYGPAQRPDMAFHKFFKAALEGKNITIYGDGSQTRDFTYIDDIVEAILSAFRSGKPGEIYNLGGGKNIILREIFPLIENVCQKKITINHIDRQYGDVSHTFADITKARKDLGFSPRIKLEQGLTEEWKWIQNIYGLV